MRTKDFVDLGSKLLHFLPGFTLSGRLLLMTPVKETLRGINLEGSEFDKKSFYVNMFVLPLCVPTEHLYFNFGNRVRHRGGGDRWSADMPNLIGELGAALEREALPFLRPVESLRNFVEVAKSFSFKNPHTAQAIAYALVRLGDLQDARVVLDQLLRQIDLNVPWQKVIAERAEALVAELRNDPSAAQRRLEASEAETSKNLGLEAFR